jgi:predicted Zn-dependent protease
MRTSVALVLLSVSCATFPAARSKSSSSSARSRAQVQKQAPPDETAEVRAGKRALAALEAQGLVVHDAQVEGYVDRVARRLFAVARAQRPGLAWEVHVLDEPGVVRVRATEGGYLYVSSGLILLSQSETDVAAALAHAVGHVVARHASAGEQPYGRVAEREADELAAFYLARAGWDPQALPDLLSSLSGPERAERAQPFLRAHPVWPERQSHLDRYLAEHPFAGPPYESGGFELIKKRIEIAAAAPRMGL